MEWSVRDPGREVLWTERSDEAEVALYEYAWNHTTLHALKKDKNVTYLQAAMMPGMCADLVRAVEDRFGVEELVQHLEVVRFGGRVGFASLALLTPRGESKERRAARLEDIMAWHEENGIHIFNPHTHVLEDGGMKETDWAQLGFKAGADPGGVLNPGKMRAWEEQRATSEDTDPKGSFSAAYRLAAQRQDAESGSGGEKTRKINMATTTTTTTTTAGGGSHENDVQPRSTRPKSRLWAEWTTENFATANLRDAVAILPLGAVEAHGPHLPLGGGGDIHAHNTHCSGNVRIKKKKSWNFTGIFE